MHISELTGKLVDYYETHVKPNLGNKLQFGRTMNNLVFELQTYSRELTPVHHYLQCAAIGEIIVKNLRTGTEPTEEGINEFRMHLRQMDMAAKVQPKWFSVQEV